MPGARNADMGDRGRVADAAAPLTLVAQVEQLACNTVGGEEHCAGTAMNIGQDPRSDSLVVGCEVGLGDRGVLGGFWPEHLLGIRQRRRYRTGLAHCLGRAW